VKRESWEEQGGGWAGVGQGGDDRQQTDPPTSQTPLPLPPIPKPQGATADSLTNSKHLNFETLKNVKNLKNDIHQILPAPTTTFWQWLS
jgi:hypothetical protein